MSHSQAPTPTRALDVKGLPGWGAHLYGPKVHQRERTRAPGRSRPLSSVSAGMLLMEGGLGNQQGGAPSCCPL